MLKMASNSPIINDIEEIIRLGRSWGMKDEEISECLAAGAIGDSKTKTKHGSSGHNKKQAKNKGSTYGWIWTLMKVLIASPIIVIVILWALYMALMVVDIASPEYSNAINKFLSPYIHPAMKQVRIWFKPIVDKFDVGYYYNSECLVKNPIYFDPIDDCGPCAGMVTIPEMTNAHVSKVRRYINEVRPFVLKKHVKTPVTYTMLQKLYFENENRFEHNNQFSSNIDGVYNISDLFYTKTYEDILNAKHGFGHVTWISNSVPTAQVIRRVFPRPDFVMPEAETSLGKNIFIRGPRAVPQQLPQSHFANNWFVQAYGSTAVTLWPHPDCEGDCKDLSFTLNAGDLLYVQDQYWRIELEPLLPEVAKDELSITFSSSFTY